MRSTLLEGEGEGSGDVEAVLRARLVQAGARSVSELLPPNALVRHAGDSR